MEIEATRRLRTRLRTPEAQGKAERLMDIVGTISHGRGATLGARQLWARMSGTMRRLRQALHTLLEQARRGQPCCVPTTCVCGSLAAAATTSLEPLLHLPAPLPRPNATS
jgi:hypothetical protein